MTCPHEQGPYAADAFHDPPNAVRRHEKPGLVGDDRAHFQKLVICRYLCVGGGVAGTGRTKSRSISSVGLQPFFCWPILAIGE